MSLSVLLLLLARQPAAEQSINKKFSLQPSALILSGVAAGLAFLSKAPAFFLAPFFEEIHKAAEDEGLRKVRVDVQGLRFLNSSAVKELIAWVLKRNRMAPSRKYIIEFVYDSTVLWQRVTLPTLSHLDADFIVLDDRSKVAGNA